MELERRAETEEALRKKQRLRAALEEQERVAKATAGFNHLEIPAELAFIYSKLEGERLTWEEHLLTGG